MRYSPVFLVLIGLEAGCATGSPVMTTQSGIAPPKAAVSAVNSQWKGSKLVDLSHSAAGCANRASQPYVSGDFNGDGVNDVAMLIQTPAGLKVVAAMLETYDYTPVDIPTTGDLANASLSVRPRGQPYRLGEGDMEDYLGTDTIVVAPCGQPETAYIWTGSGFKPEALAEQP